MLDQNETYQHETIKLYTAALLNLFSNVSIQYRLKDGTLQNKKVPLMYSNREKYQLLDELSEDQLNTNHNLIPLGYVKLQSITRDLERAQNKHAKINPVRSNDKLEFMFNSLPFDFEFELAYMCRGMNESTQIIEQIATLFNPNYHLEVNDVRNLDKPSSIPVRLMDIQFEADEYDPLSSNIITIRFNLTLSGHLYMPVMITPRIKEFDIRLNEIINENEAVRKSLLEWNVDYEGTPY